MYSNLLHRLGLKPETMNSQQNLPTVQTPFGLDNMKHGYLRSPLDLLSNWDLSVINNSKTFDYNKQMDHNCHRMDVDQLLPKNKKHSKKRRQKKRKQNQNNSTAMEVVEVVGGDSVDGCYSPNKVRCRLPSECESEDSFIVFDDNSSGLCQEASWAEFCIDSDHTDNTGDSLPNKKVRFASAEQLCEVHPMVQWSYAYRKARKGPWEQCALDRMRFQNRINNTKPILDYVLEAAHRNQVYKDRFKE